MTGLATVEGEGVYFADAWRYGGDMGPGYTYDRRNGYAALTRELSRRIDYILIRGPDRRFRGEPLKTRVVFNQPKQFGDQEVWPSDHFGVMTEVAAEPREQPFA